MADTPNWIQARIEEMLPTLNRLLTAPEVPFDERLRSALPEDPGIYAITTRAAANGQFIRAGKTDVSLRERLYRNHWMGNQNGNLRQQLVKDGICTCLDETKPWIRHNCVVRFLVMKDPKARTLSEHFMLAVLKPKYIDEGRRGLALLEES